MEKIYAEVVADSVANGVRLTTLSLNFPRFVLPELNTHRQFSRNSASSRAIPLAKTLEQVSNNPVTPIHWGKNQPGMQAAEELDGTELLMAQGMWKNAAYYAYEHAKRLQSLGAHKQWANRLLEPFVWTKTVVTATEWDNFFRLRLDPASQPEMQELAKQMFGAMLESKPVELTQGEWHLPFVDRYDDPYEAIACSVARCARVSYLNHDGSKPSVEKDMALFDRLIDMGHMSPLEHQATPMDAAAERDGMYWWWNQPGVTHQDADGQLWSANFRGWVQYRQTVGK